jgi:Holliday junction resolvase
MNYQTKVMNDMKAEGWKVIKTIRLNENGFPDLMCLKNGKVVFIEIKEANDTLKVLQKYRIDELIKLGFEAYCLQATKGIIYPIEKEEI